ncbi:hypothetical protein A2482_02015 [Candidatus Falkowbacteria bacterium RIFOXYC2_FULL_48_21]|uniref:Uncharacterized protein n=1 Tax=Candidatus Falkowbacteria bacterium RIFOXYC2_FULL_48_21 TaxID=1798005 RepID=A0A1F5T785_9BACT|nr:MAG: hypothetical protein A2482_02015 [Candidatus Falkowbacteria bacterium RIFOXYC2_FULL_48_21]
MSKRKKGYSYWNIFFVTLVGDIIFATLTILAINSFLTSNHEAWDWFGAAVWIVLGKIISGQATDIRVDAEIGRAFRVRGLDKDDY